MSVKYYSDNYCGGYGELANPLQWPQLRKRRRLLVALSPPPPPPTTKRSTVPLLLLLQLQLGFCGIWLLVLGLTRPTIRSRRERPWRPWSAPLAPSLILLRQTPLLPKVTQKKKKDLCWFLLSCLFKQCMTCVISVLDLIFYIYLC